MKDVEIKVKGGKRNYLELLSELSEISKRVGCNFSFVSSNPGLHVNPEIYVPETYAEKFRAQLEALEMLYNAEKACYQAIEEFKSGKKSSFDTGEKIELRRI